MAFFVEKKHKTTRYRGIEQAVIIVKQSVRLMVGWDSKNVTIPLLKRIKI